MFDLVNDIERYPEFLHWCRGARVDLVQGSTIEATLDIGVLGFHQSFRTRNTLKRPERIGIDWCPGLSGACAASGASFPRRAAGPTSRLALTFEVTVSPFGIVFAKVFEELAASQMTAFVEPRQEGLRREHVTSLRAPRCASVRRRLQLEVAVDACDAVVLEVHDNPPPVGVRRAPAAKVIGVVPAIAVKAVGDHRRAEQELDLTACHAEVDLDDVLVVEQIALLDVDAIDASCEGESGESDERGSISHEGWRSGGAAAGLTS